MQVKLLKVEKSAEIIALINGVIDVRVKIKMSALHAVKKMAIQFYEIKHAYNFGNARMATMGF